MTHRVLIIHIIIQSMATPNEKQPLTYPAICPGHQKAVVELSWASQGDKIFVSASLDKLPMLRDGVSGDWIGTFVGHKGAVWSAKLNAMGTLVATGAADFCVKVWSAISGQEIASLEHSHVVRAVAWSPDGRSLATGGHDRAVRIFSTDNWEVPPHVLPYTEKVNRLAWIDNASIVAGYDDGSVRILDLRSGTCSAQRKLNASVADMELSADGTVLTIAAGHSVWLLGASTLTTSREHVMPFLVSTVSLHPKHMRVFLD